MTDVALRPAVFFSFVSLCFFLVVKLGHLIWRSEQDAAVLGYLASCLSCLE